MKNKLQFKKEIERLLKESDAEFVPPLSSRHSTTDDFRSENNTIDDYLSSVLEQEIICCIKNGKVLGFLSYRDNYVSTIIVDKAYRGLGIGEFLWKSLLKTSQNTRTTTRTWSTNEKHIFLLKKLGFKEFKRIKNDRGKGIDSVYFEIFVTKNKKAYVVENYRVEPLEFGTNIFKVIKLVPTNQNKNFLNS